MIASDLPSRGYMDLLFLQGLASDDSPDGVDAASINQRIEGARLSSASASVPSAERTSGERFEIQAIGLDTHQRRGEAAEAAFLAKVAGVGFGVAKPWGVERYDFILDSGHNFWRVQVKSTRVRLWSQYVVRIATNKLAPYNETEIDFLVAYLVPEQAWYVIPVEMLKGRNSLYFYPRARGKSKWEKYREAWCLMACPNEENGPSKIETPRCRDQGPVRMAICPLKVFR